MEVRTVTERDREKFWAKVDKRGPDECWEWRSTKNTQGYGRHAFRLGPYTQQWHSAHRVTWAWSNGREPGEMCVLHKCDNPGCVNPAHLFLGTDLDNARDKAAKGRSNPPKGVRNCKAKLTEQQVRDIRANAALCRVTLAELGARYGVTPTTIDGIVKRRFWKHI